MDTDTLRIIIPITTFVLGSALTLLVKSFERRRDTKRRSVSSIQRLTNEWYNQLHEIFGKKAVRQDPELVHTYTNYLNNRIILPELLMHLEVLKGFKDAHQYVVEVESFLGIVTNYSKFKNNLDEKLVCPSLHNDSLPKDQFLDELDSIIQRIAIQTGVLLR